MNTRDNIDLFFNYSYCPSKRTIYLVSYESDDDNTGFIDYKTTEIFIKAMVHLNTISKKPIFIYINSIGGDVHHGMAIFDLIQASRSPVCGIGIGCVASISSVILQACDLRIITNNCVLMIHNSHIELSGSHKSVESWTKFYKIHQRQIHQIYYDRIKTVKQNITLSKVEKICNHDQIFIPKKAIEYGLADRIMKSTEDPYQIMRKYGV